MPVSSVWLVAVSMKTVLPEYETNASTRLKLNVTVSIPPNPLMPELPDGAVKESGPELPLNTGSPGFNVDLLLPAIVEHSPFTRAHNLRCGAHRSGQFFQCRLPHSGPKVIHFWLEGYRKQIPWNLNGIISCRSVDALTRVNFCGRRSTQPLRMLV